MDLHKEIEFEKGLAEYLAAHGWLYSLSDAGYDRERALFPEDVLGWLADTQPGQLDKVVKAGGDTARGDERVRVASEVVTIEVADPFVSLSTEPQSVRRGERVKYRWAVKQMQPFEGQASVRMVGLPVGMSAVGPEPTIDKNSTEVAVELEARDEALLGLVNELKCDVRFTVNGEEISLRTGSGKLRIDPRLEK